MVDAVSLVSGMISVPYTVELNDLVLFDGGLTGPEFLRIVQDRYADCGRYERAMTR